MYSKEERKNAIVAVVFLIALMAMSCWSVYVYKNNVYMEYREVPVTFIDKYTVQSCYKGRCHDEFEGLFKTKDGIVFDRPITAYMYRFTPIGFEYDMTIRQFDIRQTTHDNLYWLHGSLVVYLLTFALWVMGIVALIDCIRKRHKHNKPKPRSAECDRL